MNSSQANAVHSTSAPGLNRNRGKHVSSRERGEMGGEIDSLRSSLAIKMASLVLNQARLFQGPKGIRDVAEIDRKSTLVCGITFSLQREVGRSQGPALYQSIP